MLLLGWLSGLFRVFSECFWGGSGKVPVSFQCVIQGAFCSISGSCSLKLQLVVLRHFQALRSVCFSEHFRHFSAFSPSSSFCTQAQKISSISQE